MAHTHYNTQTPINAWNNIEKNKREMQKTHRHNWIEHSIRTSIFPFCYIIRNKSPIISTTFVAVSLSVCAGVFKEKKMKTYYLYKL